VRSKVELGMTGTLAVRVVLRKQRPHHLKDCLLLRAVDRHSNEVKSEVPILGVKMVSIAIYVTRVQRPSRTSPPRIDGREGKDGQDSQKQTKCMVKKICPYYLGCS
jgi:hypothetical protein